MTTPFRQIVNMPIEVTGEMTGWIAVTAIEGGIGYWARAEAYDFTRWMNDIKPEADDVAPGFVFYTVRADVEDDGSFSGPPLDVTPEVIAKGIQLFLTGVRGSSDNVAERDFWNFAPRPFDDMEDLPAMDSAEADCVIQLGLFGKLVYG